MELIVAITGASGSIYGVRLLEELKERRIKTHLIITKAAAVVFRHEIGRNVEEIASIADYCYDARDLEASVASGSYVTDGMIIIPCSMKTLAAIAHGYSSNLVARAADVVLKEKRTLVIVPRETPLNVIHLQNMLSLAGAGAIILPAMPAFYHRPETITGLVNHVVGKVLDVLGIEHELYKKWQGKRTDM